MTSDPQLWFAPAGGRNSPAAASQGAPKSVAAASRVLIVEDELFVAWHLETLAREFGYDVVGFVPDGEGAIEQSTDAAPDLVLMDIHLAGQIDGVEAARRIRERRNVAVIFITAFADATTLGRIQRLVPGAQVLTKPVAADRLRDAISKALTPSG